MAAALPGTLALQPTSPFLSPLTRQLTGDLGDWQPGRPARPAVPAKHRADRLGCCGLTRLPDRLIHRLPAHSPTWGALSAPTAERYQPAEPAAQAPPGRRCGPRLEHLVDLLLHLRITSTSRGLRVGGRRLGRSLRLGGCGLAHRTSRGTSLSRFSWITFAGVSAGCVAGCVPGGGGGFVDHRPPAAAGFLPAAAMRLGPVNTVKPNNTPTTNMARRAHRLSFESFILRAPPPSTASPTTRRRFVRRRASGPTLHRRPSQRLPVPAGTPRFSRAGGVLLRRYAAVRSARPRDVRPIRLRASAPLLPRPPRPSLGGARPVRSRLVRPLLRQEHFCAPFNVAGCSTGLLSAGVSAAFRTAT